MRSLTAALAVLFLLGLPVLAQAGEGCPHAKQNTTTASYEVEPGDAPHADFCQAECPHAAAMAKAAGGQCPCRGAAAESAEGEVELRSVDTVKPASTVAVTD